jgi:prepilin-type N-terminal cleavage/methylation domain-containing protein
MPFDRKTPALPAAVRDRNAPRSAFTLVELLVTIAVIAVLAALASAALPAVLESGHRVQCQARLSHLGQALLLYAQDNAMTLPGAGKRPTGNPVTSVCYTYTRDILPYLGLTEEAAKQQRALFCCPSRTDASTGTFQSPHYVFSGANNAAPLLCGLSGTRLSAIKKPARTVLMAEAGASVPFSNHPFEGTAAIPDAKCWLFFVDGHSCFLPIYSSGGANTLTRDPPASYGYQWSPN